MFYRFRLTMQILIIRHAIAEEPENFDGPDELRPLTAAGRRKMRDAARGLTRIIKRIDVLATSPLLRAVQTAQIAAEEFKRIEPIEVGELAPGVSAQKLLQWLQKHDADQTIALVGHEPGLSQFIGYLVTARPHSIVNMKKGACCLIEFEDKAEAGHGVIQWLMKPRALRALSDEAGE